MQTKYKNLHVISGVQMGQSVRQIYFKNFANNVYLYHDA